MSDQKTNQERNKSSYTPRPGNGYRIQGYYNINDVKFDLLKIIQPFDGYMYNDKDTGRLVRLFKNYLSDLRYSHKIHGYEVVASNKNNTVTLDVQVTMQRDRSPKKLKIHVGKLIYKPQVA